MVENGNAKEIQQVVESLSHMQYCFTAKQVYTECVDSIRRGNRFENTRLCELICKEVLTKDSDRFKIALSTGDILYRARILEEQYYKNKCMGHWVRDGKTNGFDEMNSGEAPLGVPQEGRNNIRGVSYMYLSEDEVTACAEIKSCIRDFISVSKFEVMRPLKLVNFSDEKDFLWDESAEEKLSLGTLFTHLMAEYTIPVRDSSNYGLTQIISDYIRKTGVDGICYGSFFTGKRNYTIFNSHESNIKFCNSRIMLHQCVNHVFLNFNDEKIIQSDPQEFAYNKELSNIYLNNSTFPA